MKRRSFIQKSSSASLFALSMPAIPSFSALVEEMRFGIAEASYVQRRYAKLESNTYPPFTDSLQMIEHSGSEGFGGVQFSVSGWDAAYAKKVKTRVEELELFLEGQIRLPNDDSDLQRFTAEVSAAKEAGVDILRTACLSGRRYETFDTMSSFQEFRTKSINSLKLAEPVVRNHDVKLAVENHKDWRIAEMIEILNLIDSEWVGVNLDTGNNISLLEDPMEVVEALAPYAFTVHLKDMAVEEYEDGFLLAEINLGEGFLDIDKMITVIKKHNPEIRFNLEMITRDPLKIPYLTEGYWATFDQISGNELAGFLYKIKKEKSASPLTVISKNSADDKLALELKNNKDSLKYARQRLGFI
ncbi:MAG: TIM barrel protein [Eudoraea sp.]|uniref:sugar phosphate isomerase/epimerase family protein n=1 Tax=Eudoraea sp. TaxID=1979955 RepID=UPI003C707483